MIDLAPVRLLALLAFLALPLACTVGCSSASSGSAVAPAPLPSVLSRDDAVALARGALILPALVTVGAASNWVLLDTGSPYVDIDPDAFPSVSSFAAAGTGEPASIVLGGQTLRDIATLASTSWDTPPGDLYGLVGFSAFTGHVAAFDYQAVSFTLDPASPPPGLEAPVTFPFSLQGGALPGYPLATRLIVPVVVEGTTYQMLVDTGASELTVSETLWNALTADGRPTSATANIPLLGNPSTTATRARSVTVGGVERDAVLVAYDVDFAASKLAALSDDVGQTIDASLGGAFLAAFYLTIDYPNQQVSLAKYSDPSYLLDPAERLSVYTQSTGGEHLVIAVAGDAAAQGIAVGDQITAIDGTELASLDALALTTMFLGAAGTTHQLTLGSAATLAGQTVTVAIEDQLPLP